MSSQAAFIGQGSFTGASLRRGAFLSARHLHSLRTLNRPSVPPVTTVTSWRAILGFSAIGFSLPSSFVFSQEALDTATDALQQAADAVSSPSASNDVLSIRMAQAIFVLMIYATIGVIILTIDNWRNKENEKREIARFFAERGKDGKPPKVDEKMLREGNIAWRKSQIGPDTDPKTGRTKDGMNRISRRLDRRRKEQETRAAEKRKRAEK